MLPGPCAFCFGGKTREAKFSVCAICYALFTSSCSPELITVFPPCLPPTSSFKPSALSNQSIPCACYFACHRLYPSIHESRCFICKFTPRNCSICSRPLQPKPGTTNPSISISEYIYGISREWKWT